jgi:hypothetical protein
MAMPGLSVEGPDFAERVRNAEAIVQTLEERGWDFEAAPEIFGRAAACDVAAKEIIHIHDGRMQIRLGRLVMRGAGSAFNLMSPESALSVWIGSTSRDFMAINRQVGSAGLEDIPEFREFGTPQRVRLYNPTLFYQRRDVVFWSALYECGLFPSGFENLSTHISAGKTIRNVLFDAGLRRDGKEAPIFLEAHAGVSFPTPVVEWMDKPLYGGMSPETIHVESLLTPEPVDESHPYLPLVGEGKVKFRGQTFNLRRFEGISPKDAVRGPDVGPEAMQQ